MASNYFNLPRPSVGDQSLNLNPLTQLANDYGRNVDQHNALMQRQQEIDYRQQRDAKQDQRQATQDARQQVEWFGKQASAIDRLQGPQRATAWRSIIARHPNAAGLSPDYLDPMKGPAMVAAEAGQWRDPREDRMADLELQYKQAQIGKLQAEAQDTGSAYGKTGQVFQDPQTGQFYSVQFGADGSRKIEPLSVEGKNLTPSRGVGVVGDVVYDKATGGTVRGVGPEITRGEIAKGEGTNIAKARAELPKTAMALKQYQEQDKVVGDSIAQAVSQANGWTTGLMGAAASGIPGTAAHDLRNTLNTIKSNLGLDKLQNLRDNSPTGGALGQVSEMENILLQSTWGSVEQSQSKEQLIQNLNRIKAIREQYATLKQQAYEQDVARFGAQNVPNPGAPSPPTDLKSKYGLE